MNQKRGRRWSAARGFLKPVLNRSNLRLITGAHAKRLLIEGGRAAGIEFERDGETQVARAQGEIILSAGSIGTPQILELSGVGDGHRLKAIGVEVVHHLPGVGENLQDHLQLRPVFKVANARTLNTDYRSLFKRAWMGLEYALARRGPLTMAPSQLGIFARSSSNYATPNLQFHIQPLSLDTFGEPMHAFAAITVSVCNLRPRSRGSVHVHSAVSRAAPAIRPNYLTDDEDRRVAVDSIRLTRKLCAARVLAPYSPQEFRPGSEYTTDEQLLRLAGDIGTTIFHPVGTAKMGTKDDSAAVLDARLRLRGIAAVRVADASVMPCITSGNTNSPTMMIAEKASDMILADARARTVPA